MADSFSKTIADNLRELEKLGREAGEFLEGKVSFKTGQAVELALEEMITNTIKYGYEDRAEHQIEVLITLEENLIRLTITDDGHEFNPLTIPDADTSKPIEERDIGGLGIHLVRKLTASMNYKRVNGKNILEMTLKS